VACVESSVEFRVGSSIGVTAPGGRPGMARRPVGGQGCGACQRSSTRRRRVPPSNHRGWPAGVVPGRPSSTNGCAAGPALRRDAGHSRLTAGHPCPTCTTSLGAIHVASTPGEGPPPGTPSGGGAPVGAHMKKGPSGSRGLLRAAGHGRVGAAADDPAPPGGATSWSWSWWSSAAWASRRASRCRSPAGSWSSRSRNRCYANGAVIGGTP
jgi:hypothetical protein